MHHPTPRIAHTTAFVTPVVDHWLEREIAQWVHHMKDQSDAHRTMSERSYHGATSRSAKFKGGLALMTHYYYCKYILHKDVTLTSKYDVSEFWAVRKDRFVFVIGCV